MLFSWRKFRGLIGDIFVMGIKKDDFDKIGSFWIKNEGFGEILFKKNMYFDDDIWYSNEYSSYLWYLHAQ